MRETAETLAHEIDLDGWRMRALHWTVAHDPEHAASLFSLGEILVLGGGLFRVSGEEAQPATQLSHAQETMERDSRAVMRRLIAPLVPSSS